MLSTPRTSSCSAVGGTARHVARDVSARLRASRPAVHGPDSARACGCSRWQSARSTHRGGYHAVSILIKVIESVAREVATLIEFLLQLMHQGLDLPDGRVRRRPGGASTARRGRASAVRPARSAGRSTCRTWSSIRTIRRGRLRGGYPRVSLFALARLLRGWVVMRAPPPVHMCRTAARTARPRAERSGRRKGGREEKKGLEGASRKVATCRRSRAGHQLRTDPERVVQAVEGLARGVVRRVGCARSCAARASSSAWQLLAPPRCARTRVLEIIHRVLGGVRHRAYRPRLGGSS